ncbi:MAG: DUF3326 domain-containing protein [Armatimonadetes bacterium]|nr:DUF3326 domain-containing protein [Armatimonadota bacterium]
MRVYEKEFDIALNGWGSSPLDKFKTGVVAHAKEREVPIRAAITMTDSSRARCEIGFVTDIWPDRAGLFKDIFGIRQRQWEDETSFNVALIVPTGIGCEIGGHAGDAGAVAKLVGECCDRLITHPNVVNASDINALPGNGLYVEGSTLSRLLLGTIRLKSVRSNRVLVIIEKHQDERFIDAAINSVNGAIATYGMKCPAVVILDPPLDTKAIFTQTGSAAGSIEGLEGLFAVLDAHKGTYDAVALTSVIDVPDSWHEDYFKSGGEMVNPWGGVEAMLTHAVSLAYDLPVAHAPMMDSRKVEEMDPGRVDSRMAAEAVSLTFINCLLEGLHRSPQVVRADTGPGMPASLGVENVSCLVIPDGCIGLPTLAALEQGIPVIAVQENRNRMQNDLGTLPWPDGQFWQVENYLEACGLLLAMNAGLDPRSVRRPLASVRLQEEAARHGKREQQVT